MKTIKLALVAPYVLAMSASLLTACGGSSNSSSDRDNTTGPSEKYQGVWVSPAYGTGLKVEADRAELFSYTTNFCLLEDEFDGLSDADIEASYRLSQGNLELFSEVGVADFHAPTQRLYPATMMPEACIQGYTPQVGDEEYQVNALQDYEMFSELMANYSVSPEAQDTSWDSIDQIARTALDPDMTEMELLDLFYQMIEPLRDIHTTIQTSDAFARVVNKPITISVYFQEYLAQEGISLPLSAEQAASANAYIGAQIERHESNILGYAEDESDIKQAANGLVKWFQVGNVGYLNIAAMTGFSTSADNAVNLNAIDAALDSALTDLQDMKGLIVDVRTNGGGQDFLSLAIASRFVTDETLVYRKQAGTAAQRDEVSDVIIEPRGATQYLNPVVLLTSASTVSGAEVFALAMSELPQVILIGEATQGAFSDALEKQLPNGFKVNLSNERYLKVDGEWLEGQGVPVDIEVPVFTLEEREGEFDYAIEAAAALLQGADIGEIDDTF